MLIGTSKDHYSQIIQKINNMEYFGLIRPADGEFAILQNTTITNCDNWTFTKNDKLYDDLKKSVTIQDKNLYIGIPCNSGNGCCQVNMYNSYIQMFNIPLSQQTYANIFCNANHKEFIAFLKGYAKGFYLITSGIKENDLPIVDRFIIDPFLVNSWSDQGDSVTADLEAFITGHTNQLFLFSAGPLSKVWIPHCMKINPNNIYLDVGSSIDIFTKDFVNREYFIESSKYTSYICNND